MIVLDDEYSRADLIGYAPYREGLCELIKSIESGGSFTIGIYGEWGLGKTSLMRQIQEEIEQSPEQGEERAITVWFNPWRFVADDHLIIPFFHTLIATLDRTRARSESERLKRKLGEFLKKIAQVPLSLAYGLEANLRIPFLLESKLRVDRVMDRQEEAEHRIAAESHEGCGSAMGDEDYESLYYTLAERLQMAARDLDCRIVVFLDDLDRCLPEKAIELLEATKVLLDLPGFIFVVGVARDMVERGIRIRYRALFDSANDLKELGDVQERYLDKIVQFPFSLPTPTPGRIRESILLPALERFNVSESFGSMIVEALGSNPRTIKRFINAVSFALRLADGQTKEGREFEASLVIRMTLIGYMFPRLYRQLEVYPEHIVRLEKIIREAMVAEPKSEQRETRRTVLRDIKKTDLPLIDAWLRPLVLSRLVPVLAATSDREKDVAFGKVADVGAYVSLLSTSLSSDGSSDYPDALAAEESVGQTVKERMVLINPGTFTMGAELEESFEAEITYSFWIDKYPVTQTLYDKVMGVNPSRFVGADRPVEGVSWFDAIGFCNVLSDMCELPRVYERLQDGSVSIDYDSRGFRLPTEAEWEFACTNRGDGLQEAEIAEQSWYDGNSQGQTHGVGQKIPNGLGLYDMLGNVWEWCNDWVAAYPKARAVNPKGPEGGRDRCLRGGSWANYENSVTACYRNGSSPDLRDDNQGYRLVLRVPDSENGAHDRGSAEDGEGESYGDC